MGFCKIGICVIILVFNGWALVIDLFKIQEALFHSKDLPPASMARKPLTSPWMEKYPDQYRMCVSHTEAYFIFMRTHYGDLNETRPG